MSSEKVSLPGIKEKAWVFFCGLCMGAADLVPGISGGTMAFIMGIYENLLKSIKSVNVSSLAKFFRGQKSAFSWEFLSLLILGVLFSLGTLVSSFHKILNHPVHRIYLYSAFLGLILGSVYFLVRQVPKWRTSCFVALAIGAVSAFCLTQNFLDRFIIEKKYDAQIALDMAADNYVEGMLLDIPKSHLEIMLAKKTISYETPLFDKESGLWTDPLRLDLKEKKFNIDLWIVFCGSIAICAMLLPGISGSYLLTILGLYPTIIKALNDFVHGIKKFTFDTDAFMVLSSLSLGIVMGAMLFSRFISWLLTTFHSFTIALLTGFMLGALNSVWPFWSYMYFIDPLKLHKVELRVLEPYMPKLSDPVFWYALTYLSFGFFAVILFELLAQDTHKETAQSAHD